MNENTLVLYKIVNENALRKKTNDFSDVEEKPHHKGKPVYKITMMVARGIVATVVSGLFFCGLALFALVF